MVYIQFVSDFVCPFCYVARAALLEAIKDFDVEIDWLPYESTPSDQPQVDTFHDPVKRQRYRKHLTPLCRNLRLNAKLPPKVVPRPYTRLATEGRLFAEQHGKEEAYAQRVLDACYLEEQDIGKAEVLTQLADEVGLDRDAFREALRSGTYARMVEQLERDTLEDIRPKTLPTILIGNSVRLDGGVYSVEQFRTFLRRAEAEEEALTLSGAGCGNGECRF